MQSELSNETLSPSIVTKINESIKPKSLAWSSWVLASIIVTANPGEPLFSEQVATMTWVSFAAVFVITLSIVGKGYLDLISGVEKITGLKKEDFLKV